MEPTTGIEPVTSSLPRKCSTPELRGHVYITIQLSTRLPPAREMERVMGIEPTSSAWKAEVLPLNYTRKLTAHTKLPGPLVEGAGFEPA